MYKKKSSTKRIFLQKSLISGQNMKNPRVCGDFFIGFY